MVVHRSRWLGLLAVAAAAAGLLWWTANAESGAPLPTGGPAPPSEAAAGPAVAPAEPPVERTAAAAPAPSAPADPLAAGPPSGPSNMSARFRGRCVAAESRQPLADCAVKLDENGPAAAHSAADGTFDVAAPFGESARVRLRIEAPGRVPRIGDFEHVRDGAVEDLGDVALPRGFVVTGRVVDPDGVGVTGHNVLVFGVDTKLRDGQFGRSTAEAVCAADGTFTLSLPLPPGDHLAGVWGPRRQRGDGAFRVDATTGCPPLVLVVEPQNEITGVVVDELGKPVMDVELTTEHGGAVAESGPNGRFRLVPQQAVTGPTRVLLRDPGNWSPAFVAPTVDWGQRDVRLVLPRGPTVTIEAVDDRGEPVTEFGVLFVPQKGSAFPFSRDHGTHPEGKLVVPTTRLGRHVLRVLPKAPDLLASEPQFVDVDSTQALVLRVPLERLPAVDVVVVDAAGSGVQGADVRLVRIGHRLDHARRGQQEQDLHQRLKWRPEKRSPELVSAALSDTDGRAALFAPTATNGFLLRVKAKGHEPTLVQDPALSPTAPLRVVLARAGALSGRVELHGQSRDLFQVDLRRADDGAMEPERQLQKLQSDGTFAVPMLPVGDYAVTVLRQIQVREPGSASWSFAPFGAPTVRVRVDPAATAEVELDAPPIVLGSLRGRIAGLSTGTGHAVLLSLLGTRNAQRGMFPLATDGSFVADELPPGRYQLAVSAGNPFDVMPALLAPEFEIAPGGAQVQDFVFTRRRLTIELRTPTGEPVQGEVEVRCGSLVRSCGVRSALVLDPAPEVPVQLRYEGTTEWSLPASMPQDRTEHALEVVVPSRR